MGKKELISGYIIVASPLTERGNIVKMVFETETEKFILYISRQLFEYMYKKMRIEESTLVDVVNENHDISEGMVS